MEYRGMGNQDELNFRRFEEIYPVYRDMGRKVKAEFQKAKEIDLFNTKEIQSQAKEIEGLRGKVKLYEQFIKNGVETNNIRIPDLIDPARKTIDELLDTTLLGTTQPDKGGE